MSDVSEFELGILGRVMTKGHQVIGVFDPDGVDRDFAYTVGISEYDLVMHGLPATHATIIINATVKMLGTTVPEDGQVFRLEDFDVPFRFHGPVDRDDAKTFVLRDDTIPLFQILWPDDAGVFPGQRPYKTEFVQQVYGLLDQPGCGHMVYAGDQETPPEYCDNDVVFGHEFCKEHLDEE